MIGVGVIWLNDVVRVDLEIDASVSIFRLGYLPCLNPVSSFFLD